ncbi:UNVERIFIED_CONTAM: hypothetical protein GTU68_043972 [Idotea baltica]|nr:hypothetical protein [Idotea baltica]
MKVCVVGSGYVGLVAAGCFAETGNTVISVDIDENKIAKLKEGIIPIFEPGLSDIVHKNYKDGRLRFTTSLEDGVKNSDIIFIAVGTPQDEDGSADLTHVLNVAEGIGTHMNGYKIIVDKSTVPVGTAEKVTAKVKEFTSEEFDVVSNPEFLKEGAAIDDFLKPDRVVIGVPNEKTETMMKELYAPFVRTNNPILVMDVVSAEMTKYAANTMLATRVSFMNEISHLCEKAGANIHSVRVGIGTDSRIGMPFLFPGIGYGGSCFPKDVQALIKTGKNFGINLEIAEAVEAVNKRQKEVLVNKIIKHYGQDNIKGKTFSIWGLAFKPQTDDVREAPALTICKRLNELGAKLNIHDPEANETFKEAYGDNELVEYFDSNYESLKDADALLVCTEWNAFRNPDFKIIQDSLKEKVIFDGRNIFKPSEMKKLGFTYYSIGRNPVIQ